MKQRRVADGTRIAYTLDGPADGPAVVLCDGISCDAYAWRYLRPQLLERYRVLHVQYRGHGRSGLPRDPDRATLPDLAHDVTEIMSAESIGEAVFIGHSMGVQVALEVAWRQPERLRAAVLLNGSYGRALDNFKHTDLGARLFPAIEYWGKRYRGLVTATVRAVLPTPLTYLLATASEIKGELLSRDDFMPYLEHFARMPMDLFFTLLGDTAQRTSLPFLPRLTQPMLVVSAEDDGFTPPPVSRLMAERLANARWFSVPAASHTAPLERPEVVNPAVMDFLDAVELGEPAAPAARPELASLFRHAARARRDDLGGSTASVEAGPV